MARVDKKKKLRPSILDRLIDNDTGNAVEIDIDQHHRLKQLRQSVRRDLESIFNTRYRVIEPDSSLSEVNNSLLNYGLPDLATVNISDKEKRKEFTQQLELLLKKYEPRFKTIKVSYLENKDTLDRTLRFRIDATLYADPSPEVVIFDSVLEPVTRTVNVEESGHG